jgi:hypothetical protein
MKKVHILAINGRQQAALKYCLFNWMQQKIVENMNNIVLNSYTNPAENFDASIGDALKVTRTYEKYSCLFPSPFHSSPTGKCMMVYYAEEDFKNIVDAVESYNDVTAGHVLPEDIFGRIAEDMPKLKDLVLRSYQFQYTLEELKKYAK